MCPQEERLYICVGGRLQSNAFNLRPRRYDPPPPLQHRNVPGYSTRLRIFFFENNTVSVTTLPEKYVRTGFALFSDLTNKFCSLVRSHWIQTGLFSHN